MDDWEDSIRGPGGVRYGVWIPRDPNYVKKQEQKAPEPPKAPANDWIKITVVDDQTGRVVPGILLDLQVPGGFTEPHETRRSGLVESLGIESGNCELSGDINDLTLKNTLLFIGVGDCPVEKAPEGFKLKGIPDPEPGARYRIAFVEKHEVKVGETLKGIAHAAGLSWHTFAKFNWGTTDPIVAEHYFSSSDIVYIPKKWSQNGLATNQQHTIRVKAFPAFIEDDISVRAQTFSKPLPYIYDPSLNKDTGGFRFVFEEGNLRCSHVIDYDKQICNVSVEKKIAVDDEEKPSFVYVDTGCWCDSPKGKDEKRRDILLVCGPHVYLCEFNRSCNVPLSRVESVQRFFTEMAKHGCGINVFRYICANTRSKKLSPDSNLFLFLGDLHLPPRIWFPEKSDLDIFKSAGTDLVFFLKALSSLDSTVKQILSFIQAGDMFELWLGRQYQFKPSVGAPEWIDEDSPKLVANWVWDVIMQNRPVMEAFKDLEHAGLATVTYLWGNHDSYLRRSEITSQINSPKREPFFRSADGNLVCEHGHRFDSKNFDNLENGLFDFGGPDVTNLLTWYPPARGLEDNIRPRVRECYLLGATLSYLYQNYDRHENAFKIYAMAHTHTRYLCRFEIQTKFKDGK